MKNTIEQVAHIATPAKPKVGTGKKAGVVMLVTTALAAGGYVVKKLHERYIKKKAQTVINEHGYDNIDIVKRDFLDDSE